MKTTNPSSPTELAVFFGVLVWVAAFYISLSLHKIWEGMFELVELAAKNVLYIGTCRVYRMCACPNLPYTLYKYGGISVAG